MRVEELVGRVAGELILEALTIEAGRAPAVRVTGFTPGEVEWMITTLANQSLPGCSDPIRVITAPGVEVIPDDSPTRATLLPEHRTLTSFRNELSENGNVFIELGHQSDREGLGTMFHFGDDQVMEAHKDGMPARLKLMSTMAWVGVCGDSVLPDALVSVLVEVFEAHRKHGAGAFALRPWAEFVLRMVQELKECANGIVNSDVLRATSGAISSLYLFPDSNLDEVNVAARIRLNICLADRLKPNGSPLTESDLLKLIQVADLVKVDGQPLEADEDAQLRSLMRRYAGGDNEARLEIELRFWEQLFQRPNSKKKLGDVVRERLELAHAERLEEFDALDVIEGLNRKDPAAARQLLEAEPQEGNCSSLSALLGAILRRSVERLASTKQTIGDPLVAILRKVHEQRSEMDSDIESNTFKVVASKPTESTRFTRSLFVLLYGATLQEVAQKSHNGNGLAFEIDESLSPGFAPLQFKESDENDGAIEPVGWDALPLTIGFADQGIEVNWNPAQSGLAVVARLLSELRPGQIFIESLVALDELARSKSAVPDPSREPRGGIALDWSIARERAFDSFLKHGLSTSNLGSYASEYVSILSHAKSNLVPSGMPLDDLDDFLEIDTAAMHGGATAVLASHPIRLRWFGEHLRLMKKLLCQGLSIGLMLNERNEDLFFDSLESARPHMHPTTMCAGPNKISLAVREFGLCEEYQPTDRGHGEQIFGGIDSASVVVMARVASKYLQEFPYKADGLKLMILDIDGSADLPARLVRELLKLTPGSPSLNVNVLAPHKSHRFIAESLAEFDTPGGHRETLMPRFQVSLFDWSPSSSLPPELLGTVDLAFAPDLFGSEFNLNNKTVSPDTRSDSCFDAWFDRPYSVVEGHAPVRDLIPAEGDEMLEHWSTLTMRRKMLGIVGTPSNIDYSSLTVQFAGHLKLFNQIHSYANWVVTLDRFIGRDQFDSAPNRPDIIMVEEGVGKSDAYTLIVSSSSGKHFVVERLAKKLKNELGVTDDVTSARELSGRLYELGRNVSPSIMLRALGLGRTAEEILGLVVARWRASEAFPITDPNAIEVWINLDDFTNWFGNAHARRADLLRAEILPDQEGGVVKLLVVESKFRKSDDLDTAIEQVQNTLDLMSKTFVVTEGQKSPADLPFWLREFASAISQVPKTLTSPELLPSFIRISDGTEPSIKKVIHDVAKGRYKFSEVQGVVSAVNTADTVHGNSIERELNCVIIRTRATGFGEILKQIMAGEAPTVGSLAEDVSKLGVITSIDQEDEEIAKQMDVNVSDSELNVEEPVIIVEAERPGMSESELKAAYQKTLNVFAQHHIAVDRPTDGVCYDQGPAFYLLRLTPRPGVKISAVTGLVNEMKLALGLAKDQEIRNYVDLGAVVFEVAKATSQRYQVDAEELWQKTVWPPNDLFAPIGEDIKGNVVGINFSSSKTPHLLISGTTGSGKSVALETILRGLCRRSSAGELKLHLVDPKRTELLAFRDSPYLEGTIGNEAQDAIHILTTMIAEMEERYKAFVKAGASSLMTFNAHQKSNGSEVWPWQVIVLDEYADLTAQSEDRKEIEALLKRLAQKGRAAGIHVIVATQRPSATIINPDVRANFPAQLALRAKDKTNSMIIIDESGAEALCGNGDALFKDAEGVVRVQCALFKPR